MSILENLTKVLPKTLSMNYQGGKKIANCTFSDVAAALCKLDDEAYYFACWYVNGDLLARSQLLGYLLRETHQIAVNQKWSIKDNSLALRRFCEAALSEWETPKLCKACNGSGIQILNICDKCSGLGKKPMTRKQLAALCGVSHGNWKKIWEDKYSFVFSLICDCQYKAECSLKKALK